MVSKTISTARGGGLPNRTFAHLVRYRTYLTPPSNPFREGKSKLQLLREVLLLVFIVSLILTVIVRLFQEEDSSTAVLPNLVTDSSGSQEAGASFETVQSQMQKLRGEIKQAKDRHNDPHRRHDEDPSHEQRPSVKLGHKGAHEGSKHVEDSVAEQAAPEEHSKVEDGSDNQQGMKTNEEQEEKAQNDSSEKSERKEEHKPDEPSTAEQHDKSPEEVVELKES